MRKIFLLLLVVMVSCSAQSSAQIRNSDQRDRSNTIHKVRLGTLDTPYVTAEQILANPKLIPNDPGCIVLEFTFSMIQKGKDITGPFTAHGPDFTDAMKLSSKSFRHTDRIFIENILLKCGYRDTIRAFPISFICRQP